MYVSIYRESVCVRNKSIVCGNRFVFTPFVCIMYELCVIECVCIPLFFSSEKTQTHTTHTLSTPAVAEYLPASQLEQVVTEVAPTAVENLPATQAVQAAELVCAVKPENFPASQLVH